MLKRKPSNAAEKEKQQKPKRSSSFGNFDRFRNNSVSKPDDSIEDEEHGENALHYRNSDPLIGTHTEKGFLKASDSMDSLYSGLSSSSGITSCSDGTSNRNSFRLDDDVPYSGPFCGRARVHTDFTPSPYDNDSLKIKKGDIIDIICKTPMGMWTGMLNNKVGNFKFIYVDVISEEEAAPKKIKTHRRSTSEIPKTLKEFLEKIHLQDYTSTLLLNGYETLEDLKDITDSHLIELNIADPEDRMRLLSAAENLLDEEIIEEQVNESVSLCISPDISSSKSQLDDCPRDSGCYMSSGNSDNGKEDLESESLPDMIEKITLTESSD
ncbi:PREDICTED: SAM domain-containing protein SAMSN-1 isoform X2 [Dipodomys ordii]|uniref:SAM domain-containing protein SAMSN-1 n=1 Tax=Dipodomys ordii TaxID=10020 RepID=A0A1S3GQW1_DIPOR|nr:PREDICTED: SAM domain-containing protein SAMSN-1 isoform X2 [Dipodomys ordii]